MDLTEVGSGRCNPSRTAALRTEAFLQVPHMPLRLISLLRALDVMKLACRTGVACLENAPQGDSLGFTHASVLVITIIITLFYAGGGRKGHEGDQTLSVFCVLHV